MNSSIELKAEELRVLADKTRLKILALLKERRELSLNEISNLTGKTKSTISDHLKLLMKAGFIDRRGVDRGYLYFLTEKGEGVLPLIEDKPYKIEAVEEGMGKSEAYGFLADAEEWLEKVSGGRRHVIPSIILGLSMIAFGYMPLSAVATSLALGLILGLLNVGGHEFIESSLLYAIFATLSAILREGNLGMILTILPSLAIFILVGGIAWMGVKLIIQK